MKLMREILDYLIVSLSEYYEVIEEKLLHFSNIIPGRVNQLILENANKIAEIVPGISSAELLYSELQLLKNDIDGFTEFSEVIDKLKIIGNGYPNAKRVYQFVLALPITVATNERYFSKLKLIKNNLRCKSNWGNVGVWFSGLVHRRASNCFPLERATSELQILYQP
jgi:hypothetical protein